MNAHVKERQADAADTEKTGSEVVVFQINPVAVLTDTERFDRFYEDVKHETEKLEIDLTTAKGRKAIASMAHKVAKTKVMIDDAGKKLNEDARKQIAVVDEARRRIREKLDALRDEVRQPLTEWEEREALRVAECDRIMQELQSAAVVQVGETADTIHARLDNVQRLVLAPDRYCELLGMAEALKASTTQTLIAAVERLRKEEADRAELERLRAEAAERAAKEQAEREAREAEDRAREQRNAYGLAIIQHIKDVGMGMIGGSSYPYPILIRELEEKVEINDQLGDHQEEARALLAATLETVKARMAQAMERAAREAEEEKAKAAAEAADNAKREVEARAQREREAAERATAEERRKAEEAHAAELARVEREKAELIARQEAEKRRQEEEAAAVKAEEERRAKDREHRSTIMGEAKAALMSACGLTEKAAKTVVLSICAGDIPHTSVKF